MLTHPDYAAAKPLPYDELRAQLAAIDLATVAGLRDYALLLVALHTGRRVAELAGMRREHVRIRARSVEISWPRCKGGKAMRDELPRGGARGEAADVLVAWIARLDARTSAGASDTGGATAAPGSTRQQSRSRGALGRERAAEPPPGRAIERLPAHSAHDERTVAGVTAALVPAVPGRPPERPVWVSLARNGTTGHPLTARAIAHLCEKHLGMSKVHALRHTFARALEDAGAKVSEIQAALGHADLGTTGRYLARLHQGENRHLGRLSSLYGLSGLDQRTGHERGQERPPGNAPKPADAGAVTATHPPAADVSAAPAAAADDRTSSTS